MTRAGPFFLLNRLLRTAGTLLLVLACFWAWRNRELADPLFNLYRAWRLGGDAAQPAHERTLTVMKVFNGESLQARDAAGNIFTVRLAGLGAPDLAHPVARERERARASRDFLASLVGTNTVRVEVTLTNESLLLLGVVHLGSTNVNVACVASGHAEFRREFLVGTSLRSRYALLQAERRARTSASPD